MRRHLLTTFALATALSLMVPPGDAAAQLSVSATGGPSFPVRSFNSRYNLGWHAQVSLGLSVPFMPIALRADGAYNSFPGETDSSFKVVSGSVNGIFSIPSLLLTPYFIGGLGVYNGRDSNVGGTPVELETTNVGANLGVGVRFGLPFLTIFGEARGHHFFSDVPRVNYVPVSIGVRF
jgi:opacity protein-like surface antigen